MLLKKHILRKSNVLLYQQVSEASLKLERDVFMYRSYTAQSKFAVVLGEIDSSYDPQLQAVKLYTEFLKATGDESKQEDILKVSFN